MAKLKYHNGQEWEQLAPNMEEYNTTKGMIGTLANLLTTAKNNLVVAINEIFGWVEDVETDLDTHKADNANPHGVTAAQIGAVTTSQLATKVDKPTTATSGNIAVFDGDTGAIKDGGSVSPWVKPGDIVIAEYESGQTGNYGGARYFYVYNPGKYRITGLFSKRPDETGTATLRVLLRTAVLDYSTPSRPDYKDIVCGSFSVTGTTLTPFSIDMIYPAGAGSLITIDMNEQCRYENLQLKYAPGGEPVIAMEV